MFNKDYAEEFLVTYLKLGYSLTGAKKSLQFLYDALKDVNGAIDYENTDIPRDPKDPGYKYGAIIDRIVTREKEIIKLMDTYTEVGILIEDSLIRMDLPEKYALIPVLFREKYILRQDDKTLMKKYKIPKTTYWRWMQIGFEHFDIPNVDWADILN